jgi:hypothetical protein
MLSDKDQKIALREANKKLALEKLLSMEGGRYLVADIIRDSGFNTFAIGSLGVEEANYRNGRRFVGAKLIAFIKSIDPSLMVQIEKDMMND